MTNYARGANFERRVKADLEQRGYFVIRSAGSHSPVDLLAMKPRAILLFVQCRISGGISADAWDELWRLVNPLWGNACVVRRQGRRIDYRRLLGPHNGKPRDPRWQAFMP